MLAPPRGRLPPARETLHQHLMSFASGRANDDLLAKMLASHALGEGVLPADFGVGKHRFGQLIERHFPGLQWRTASAAAPLPLPERDDLVKLLSQDAAGDPDEGYDVAHIVAAACQGSDHLWQDLGLWSRAELTRLMRTNFPALAARNNGDMKWKKFLYKQLCLQEGIYVCRAPSCETCVDYPVCFGSEE